MIVNETVANNLGRREILITLGPIGPLLQRGVLVVLQSEQDLVVVAAGMVLNTLAFGYEVVAVVFFILILGYLALSLDLTFFYQQYPISFLEGNNNTLSIVFHFSRLFIYIHSRT